MLKKLVEELDLQDGEEYSLWEDKFELLKLRKIREESGLIIFSMQYQNDVELAMGNIFKPTYFKYYDGYIINEKLQLVHVKLKNDDGITDFREVKIYFGIDLAIS